jgi:hypothetical protein
MPKTTRIPQPILLAAILLALIVRCDVTVLTEDPSDSPYRTKHFTIYSDSPYFGPDDLELVGMRKEYLLGRINEYLGTRYDRMIEVFITDTTVNSHVHLTEQVWEHTDYVLVDDGHEIAHVVSFQEWGYCQSSIIKEGIAVAASVPVDGSSTLQRFRSTLAGARCGGADIDNDMYELRKDITNNAWDGTWWEYMRAGAFVQFLREQFGMDAVKAWYQSCVGTSPGNAGDSFRTVFGVRLDDAIARFKTELVGTPRT